MYFDLFNKFVNMTTENLEKMLLEYSKLFTEKEANAYMKGKDFIDETKKLNHYDSSDKVFISVIIYSILQNR